VWLSVCFGVAKLPATNWRQLYGVAIVAGIGFTMSLFIAGLAFADPETFGGTRLSVVVGSVFSVLGGAAVLWSAHRRRRKAAPTQAEPFP
jgi:NhaA family Na+:H+ antiporter